MKHQLGFLLGFVVVCCSLLFVLGAIIHREYKQNGMGPTPAKEKEKDQVVSLKTDVSACYERVNSD